MNRRKSFALRVSLAIASTLIIVGGIGSFFYAKNHINKSNDIKKHDIYFTSNHKNKRTIEEIARNKKSIVLIKTSDESIGSGIIISDKGYILTSYHVIKGITKYSAFFQGKDNSMGQEAPLDLIGFDEEKDIALLKLKTTSPEHGYIPIGNSNNVKEGEKIITISSPQGIINTISDGIISGIRNEENIKYLQITAPISEGSSGGALMNMKGELIGIITFKAADGENLNFALSSRDIINFLESNMRNNKDEAGYILSNSGSTQIDSKDLEELDPWELTLARNEIYARHGYIFRNEELRKYFQTKKWYKPRENFSDEDLNEIEKDNIKFILMYEEMIK